MTKRKIWLVASWREKQFFYLLLLAFLLVARPSQAQYIPDYSAFGRGLNAGVKLGVQGLAVEVNYPFWEKFNIGAGYSFFPLGEFNLNQRSLKLKRGGVIGHLDYQPLYGKDNFWGKHLFISLGAYYYGQQRDHYIERYSASGADGYKIYFSRGGVLLGAGLSKISLNENLFLRFDVGYHIPVQDMVVVQRNDPTGEKRQKTLDDWSSFPRSFLAYGNLSAGLFYTLPFGRSY